MPKRLRYFLHGDAAVQGVVLRIFLRVVERCLRTHSPGCSTAARLGAIVFIHRFGSSLNARMHSHCCILDGVFEPASDHAAAGVVFHAASALDTAAVAVVHARMRRRVLRAYVRSGLLDQSAAADMGGWDHGGGFSVAGQHRQREHERAGRGAECAPADPWMWRIEILVRRVSHPGSVCRCQPI